MIDCPGIVPASAQDTQTAKVLKGVVRVEALSTPSEHIATLISRVKPVYLARTYNLQVPESPEESFDADEVLDKLARMKGRLLKGGEPDLDGVAKILLSDWVRGKIPYFVPPPERPEELNKAEEEKRRKEEVKERKRSKAASERTEERIHAIGVRQKLSSIVQKNTFVGEDVRLIEEEEGGESVEEGEEEGEDENEEEELGWDDVFPEDAPPPKPSDEGTSGDESAEEEVQAQGNLSWPPPSGEVAADSPR